MVDWFKGVEATVGHAWQGGLAWLATLLGRQSQTAEDHRLLSLSKQLSISEQLSGSDLTEPSVPASSLTAMPTGTKEAYPKESPFPDQQPFGGTLFPPGPLRDIVLVGAGHTHLLLLRYLIDHPIPDARFTLVSESANAWYSGMLPQVVSGEKQLAEISINAARLAKLAGARLIVARVIGVTPETRQLHLADRPAMRFNYLSINVGARSPLPAVQCREVGRNAVKKNAHDDIPLLIPVKPLDQFLAGWAKLKTYLDGHKKRLEIAVVGGGVASVELVLAIRAYQRTCRPSMVLHIHLVTRGQLIAGELPKLAQENLKLTLLLAHISVHYDFSATHLGHGGLFSEAGTRLTVDAVIWATQVTAPSWCAQSGLACDEHGFVSVHPTLQALDHHNIFAVGDLANFVNEPLPKAGVFAVRQARTLHENLGASIMKSASVTRYAVEQENKQRRVERRKFKSCNVKISKAKALRPYRPQRDFLKLLNLGNGSGLCCRNGLVFTGRWVKRWKVRLDERFLNTLRLPAISADKTANSYPLEARFDCDAAAARPAAGMFDLFEVLVHEGEQAAAAKRPVAATLTNTFRSVAAREGGKKFFSGASVVANSITPLLWGDLFRLGRHAILWGLSRVIGQPVRARRVQAILTLPSFMAPVAEHDVEQVRHGVLKVLDDPALNPNGITLGSLTAREGQRLQLALHIEGQLVGSFRFDGSDVCRIHSRIPLKHGETFSVLCTHPLGSGYWGQAALSGQLCATAWQAMTENCFQRVTRWWQVLGDLLDRRLIEAMRLIEADGVLMSLQGMIVGDDWHIAVDTKAISVLPDLVAQGSEAGTLFRVNSVAAHNFWRSKRDFDIQPGVKQLRDWPLALRALVDANVGLAWVILVKPDRKQAALEALEAAGLAHAFCMGFIATSDSKPVQGSMKHGVPQTFFFRKPQ
jgi:selenide,water dikinase